MMPAQGTLFPFATPQTVLACCRRIEAMVLTVAPEMTRQQCFHMQCELSRSTLLLESMSPAPRIPPRTIVIAPETVLLYCRDLGRLIVASASAMDRADCLRMLEELVDVTSAMEQISEAIRIGPDWQLRHKLPALPEPTAERDSPEANRLEAALRWRSPPKPITYQPRALLDFVPGRRV